MIELPCAWCGPRNVTEFRYLGEVTPRPDPATATPEEWRAYLYLRRNPLGAVEERWYHTAGCRRYVRLHRDTGTDAVTNTVTEAR
ncbi:MAG: sarcosine oxidase subunit delta [Actinophytocola sp.]|uniref:sarcosine oxidase subunit delta n=1 Tax=Actinophytocola sp. TaxID=1872138 RepID=UPI00132698B3|nr:sarcosine oxidase subunit delta [Actinophytocola sp.]MPZ80894.1 sarcosine oxidase subunit delta [Actinophytocola sp.]